MNRNNIDFTKTKACCLCGDGGNLSAAEIGRFEQYTSCKVLMCSRCVKLSGAEEKAGRLFVADVDGVPAKAAAMSAEFAAEAKKALAREWAKRGDLARWAEEPFRIVGGRTFGQVAMKAWTGAKDRAFAEKLEVIEFFKSKSRWIMWCPVCGKHLALDAPPEAELEINDVLKFRCPDGCLSFDETELASLFYDSYADSRKRLAYRPRGYWQAEQEKQSITARSCTAYALDKLAETVMRKLVGELYDVIRESGGFAKCRECRKVKSCDVCGECHDEYLAARPEINKHVADKIYGFVNDKYSFEKGMNLRRMLELVEKSNKFRASEHCRLWCAVSPDNAARGVCGATGLACAKYDGGESCRKCGMYAEGKPLGNFLATAGMCQHYENGRCLKGCGKDGKWEGREDLGVCTYKADHYVYSDRGRFCESFRLRDGLDLDAALAASRAGKSYSGFYR